MTYTVTIFKNNAGRYGIMHPKGTIHHKDFASLSYAKMWCKKQEWDFDVKDKV